MKRAIIVLILVTILVSVVTAGMIVNKNTQLAQYYTKNDTYEEEKNEEVPTEKIVLYQEYHLPIKDNVEGSSPSQMFHINPIKFTEHVYEDDNTYAIYLQIDGLADESVEKEINNRLKSEVVEFGQYAYNVVKDADENKYTGFMKYNKNKQLNYDDKTDKWNSCVRESILFNGNNALSIGITDYDNSYLSKNSYGRQKFLNFNLINGNEIKVEELFTNEYSITDGFSKELYNQLGEGEIKWIDTSHYNKTTGELEWVSSDGVYERVDVEEHERIVRKFKYTEDIQFGFNDQAVMIDFENHSVIIDFEAVSYKYIALFNRFKTNENIYDLEYSSPKNVPAFKNMSAGGTLKYSRTFEQDGKVLLNYYIYYNGEMTNEEKYAKAIDFAITKINEMVNVDVKMINENYKEDNLILYSAAFEIILGNNKIEDDKKTKYNQYLNTDVEFVTFSFNPDVSEINKDDVEYIKNNLVKALYSDSVSINTEIGRYNPKTYEWVVERKIEKNRYELYYNQLRNYFYEGGIYYKNRFKGFYITSDNYILIEGDDLIDYLVNNKEELVKDIYESSQEIWDYENIDSENYRIKVENDGNIVVSFPYMAHYTDYDTGNIVYYSNETYFSLENSTLNRKRLFKTSYDYELLVLKIMLEGGRNMSNRLFISLVTILSILIICSIAWLTMSVIEYNKVTNPESVTDTTNNDEEPNIYESIDNDNKKSDSIRKYILPSDSREIIRNELLNYDLDTLSKAYNEIFARHGHDFKNQELREYFNEQSWYKAIPGKTVAVSELTDLEYKNMEIIGDRINEIKK